MMGSVVESTDVVNVDDVDDPGLLAPHDARLQACLGVEWPRPSGDARPWCCKISSL